MGWTGDMYAGAKKYGVRVTANDLLKAYYSAALSLGERIDVIASAFRVEPTLNEPDLGYKGYVLWIYGKSSWNVAPDARVFTVLMQVNWESGAVMYKDFGLDAAEYNIPPAKFVKTLPNSLGNAWDNERLGEVRAYYKRLDDINRLISAGAMVDFGREFTVAGRKVRWFEVCRREVPNRRPAKYLTVPGLGPVRGFGRDWVKRVQQVIPAGASEPVAV